MSDGKGIQKITFSARTHCPAAIASRYLSLEVRGISITVQIGHSFKYSPTSNGRYVLPATLLTFPIRQSGPSPLRESFSGYKKPSKNVLTRKRKPIKKVVNKLPKGKMHSFPISLQWGQERSTEISPWAEKQSEEMAKGHPGLFMAILRWDASQPENPHLSGVGIVH